MGVAKMAALCHQMDNFVSLYPVKGKAWYRGKFLYMAVVAVRFRGKATCVSVWRNLVFFHYFCDPILLCFALFF